MGSDEGDKTKLRTARDVKDANMAVTAKKKYTINSLDRGLRILLILGENGGPLGVNEVSRRLNIDKSTTYRILSTLCGQGFVEQDPETRKYLLGLRVIEVAALKLRTITLLKVARSAVQKLMTQSRETVHLAVPVDGEVMYLDSEQYAGVITVNTTVGGRAPMHSSAVGKILLCWLPPEKVDNILAVKGLNRFTENTIIDPREFHQHLQKCREQGYGLDDEETHVGVRCIGAPVFDHQGNVVAAAGISGPTLRMSLDRIPILAHLVKECAMEISRLLGFVVPKSEVSVSPSSEQPPGRGGRLDGRGSSEVRNI
jgi:IclR family acetate operon transcriptional repressor